MNRFPDFVKSLKNGASKQTVVELKSFMKIELSNIEDDEDYDEEDIEILLEKIELASFALSLCKKLEKEDIIEFLCITIDCVCSFKIDEISSAFSGIFESLILACSTVPHILLSIANFCFPHAGTPSTSHENFNHVLSTKTRQKLDNDDDSYYCTHICDNILSAISSDKVKIKPEVLQRFWPLTQYLLQHENIKKEWIHQNCIKLSLSIIRHVPEKQLNYIETLLTKVREDTNLNIKEIETIMENFLENNKVAVLHRNDIREMMFKWFVKNFEVKGFTDWIVKLANLVDPEVSRKHCLYLMEIFSHKILEILQITRNTDNLHNYLDVLASVMKICKIPIIDNDVFRTVEIYVNEIKSTEGDEWIKCLESLLKVQSPTCRNFVRKLTPTPEILWTKLRNGESKTRIIKLAITIGSCHFLNSENDKKQIIPLLLLTCLKELREKFGQKWDKHRLHISGSPNRILSDLNEFTDLTLMTDEKLKLDALNCALHIDKKPRQLIQLITDMAISVIHKSTTDIEKLLPFLNKHLEDVTPDSDIINAILFNISGKSSISPHVFETIEKAITPNVKIDENLLENLVKKCSKIPEFIKLCTTILQVTSTPSKIFGEVLKNSIDMMFTENAQVIISFWEKFANSENCAQNYIPMFNKLFVESDQKFEKFFRISFESRLPDITKITIFSSLVAHLVINYDKKSLSNLTRKTNYKLDFIKHHSLFARSFVSRLLFDTKLKDEMKIREILRYYIINIASLFKFSNIQNFLQVFRSSLVYWSLIGSSKNGQMSTVSVILDFVCQEFIEYLTMSNSQISSSQNELMKERKKMITENFPSLLQNWKIGTSKQNDSMWKFCKEYCDFGDDDVRNCISMFRKEIVQRLIIVDANDFTSGFSEIIEIVRKTYENLYRGRQFSISSIVEYRSEGLDLLALFRIYFTQNQYWSMRKYAAKSFSIVVSSVSKTFFDENWWSILLVLRHSPPNEISTVSTWKTFLERIDYGILRLFLWRIVSDISRLDDSEKVNRMVWERLNFAGKLETISSDQTIQKYFWLIPHNHDQERDIAKFRKFEDLLQLMSEFEKYPITLYLDNIRLNIDRGTIWKCDLPRLVDSLILMLVKSENSNQQRCVWQVLRTLPIMNSSTADVDFVRWDMKAKFYQNPSLKTQPLLDECVGFVEKVTSPECIEFADRTLCEVSKYIDTNDEEDAVRKTSSDSAKLFYTRMNCTGKPEPKHLTPQQFDFECWLTRMIGKCHINEDPQFTSFLAVSEVKDVRFLTKLFSKFLIHAIAKQRTNTLESILTEFDQCLHHAFIRRINRLERRCATFVFYIFEFLYFFMNTKIERNLKIEIQKFWRRIIENTIKDEHGHDIPLIVRVAEKFGMEKRGLEWMEMFMGLIVIDDPNVSKQIDTTYYYTLMNLYARIGDLNGVIGSYTRLSRIQVDHVYAKILLHESHGTLSKANALYQFVESERRSDPLLMIQKALDDINSSSNNDENVEEYEKNLKSLTRWHKCNTTFETPQVFSRNIEMNAEISRFFDEDRDKDVVVLLEQARSKTLNRLSEEASIGGVCSYETALSYIVQLKAYDEIEKIRNASTEDLIDVESNFWTSLLKQTTESDQHCDYVEPILRCRRLAIMERKKELTEKDRDRLNSIVVDSHLHSASLARLRGCFELAQTSILHAKKIQPFNKRIVLEEAKLQLQMSDDETGMNLLNSLLATTFGELSKHFGDSQQTSNLDLRSNAIHQIEHFQNEEKNLYSSVQMLRITHLIRLGNTINFEKVYDETSNLLNSFVSSGVMYEAAWLLDYLNQFSEKTKTILPLLKAYKDVAKYEKNRVLQARAVERMTSLWLEYSRKLNQQIAKRTTANEMQGKLSIMNNEMANALRDVGWRAFFPAYAILARKIDHEDADVFLTIKRMMIQLIVRLPHQCMWQSVHILRSEDSKKIERYLEVLNDVKMKHPCYSTVFEQYDFASATFKLVSEKVRSTENALSSMVPEMKTMIRDKMYNPRLLEVERRGESEKAMIAGIMIPIRSDIDESVQITNEYPIASEASCQLDDRYLIHDFNENAKILSSMTKPVLVEFITLTGRRFRLLCKKEDEMTKDYYFTKMVEMCNDLLAKDEVTRISNLAATTYSIIPLAKTGGIIEFLDDLNSYYEALDEHMNLKAEKMNHWATNLKSIPRESKVDYFRNVWCKETPLVMAKWFRIQYPEAGKWYASRKMFAKSCAVMSIIGFIFGLGDRHTKNLMIHLPTGKCVHVDFDMLFNLGELLDTPEVVPFRLTRNMINGMGEVALDGEFRIVCENTLRVFRENGYEIEKYIADWPDLVSGIKLTSAIKKVQNEGDRNYTYDMHHAKRCISARLRGKLLTARLYRNNAVPHPLCHVQMAATLIELAKSDEKLVEMYPGWMPNI